MQVVVLMRGRFFSLAWRVLPQSGGIITLGSLQPWASEGTKRGQQIMASDSPMALCFQKTTKRKYFLFHLFTLHVCLNYLVLLAQSLLMFANNPNL